MYYLEISISQRVKALNFDYFVNIVYKVIKV